MELDLFISAKENREDFDAFIIKFMPIAASYASKYSSERNQFDDLFQEGCIGLLAAFDHFDPEKGVPFHAYCRFWVKNKIQKFFWRNSPVKITWEQFIAGTRAELENKEEFDIETWVIEDDRMTIQAKFLRKEKLGRIREVLNNTLTKQELEMVSLYYGIGQESLTYKEIAALFGCTKQRVHQIVKRGLSKVSESIKEQDLK